jgi:cysteine desulfurase / selenocysteine lyase
MPGLLGLGASLDLLASVGPDVISRQVLNYTDEACRRLEQVGAVIVSHRQREASGWDPRSGIVCFDFPGRNLPQVRDQLKKQQIAIGYRGGNLRISPHGYNSSADLDRLITSLEGVS